MRSSSRPVLRSSLLPLPEDEELEIASQVRVYAESEDQWGEGHGGGGTGPSVSRMQSDELGAGLNEETSFQNFKLATLYAESLHPA